MSEEAERDETHPLQDEEQEELDEDEERGGGGEGKNNCKGDLNNKLNICILTQYEALLISLP